MRIAIVTDAWAPQVNGVVRTLNSTRRELERMGHEIGIVTPNDFSSVPCPTYPEIRLALTHRHHLGQRIKALAPDALHIATEGPLGIAARNWAVERGLAFTTAYHTHFPMYLAKRTRLPAALFWRFIRWFHSAAEATLVATESLRDELSGQGLERTRLWSRGVDLDLFRPDGPFHPAFDAMVRPIQLYVGRLSVEKNLEEFLELDLPGTKVVVGDGPQRTMLQARNPGAVFLGTLTGEPLAAAYRSADVFVFPSRTDTFGLVMIEALACGTPVAGFDVGGPRDIVTRDTGSISDDLGSAVQAALTKAPAACIARAQDFTWSAAARQFMAALIPLGASSREWDQRAWMPRAA